MYFGRKHVETEPICSHKLTIFLKYHMPLRGEPGLERRKLHDIRHSYSGCLTYEMFQVLLK